MKRIFTVLLSLALVLVVGGCSSASQQPAAPEPAAGAPAASAAPEAAETPAASGEEPLDIVFVTPLIAHPVWDVARNGFEAACEEYGINGQYVGPQGIDPTEMVNQIEIAIASGVDGIVTMALSPEAMRPVCNKAIEAGIPLVFVNADDPDVNALTFIGTNFDTLGAIGAGKLMEKYDGAPIRSMVMMSTIDASAAILGRDGYLNELEKYGDFENVLVETCNSDMTTAMEKYQAAFQAYPEINCVIGVCGEAGPAAAKVAKELGRDDITIIAIDDVEETLDMIRNGDIWGTMAQNFYKKGHDSVKYIAEKVREDKNPPSRVIDSGTVLITKDNIDNYSDELQAQ